MKKKDLYFGYKMIIPGTILLIVISFYSIAMGIYYSFTDLKLTNIGEQKFIGLQNHIKLFNDPNFSSNLSFTFLFALGSIILAYIGGIIIAHLLNRKLKFIKFFRVTYLLPWLTPPIVAALMFRLLLNPAYGIINKFLVSIGLVEKFLPFFSDAILVKFVVIFIQVWTSLPFMIIILLSALQSIPGELYEAANIDGANLFQSFFYITLPSIKRMSLITVLLVFIWTFNSAELILLLTKGGPLGATTTLPVAVYRTAIDQRDLGYASSSAVIVLIVLVVVSIFYLRIQEERK